MQLSNAIVFRFPPSLDLSDIEAQLADCKLKPVGPLEMSSRGFVSPFGHISVSLSHSSQNAIWMTMGGQDRILPAGVVNELLQEKLDQIEEKEGHRPGARARKRLRDELLTELMPRAFVRTLRTDALVDLKDGLVVVNSSSRKQGEAVVSEIRRALGSFPALPLNAEVAPRAILTGWVAGDPLPDGLTLGDECELRDPADSGGVVRVKSMELSGEEITKHLEAGKQCTRLALILDDRLSFVIGEDLVVRKIKLLDTALEALESTNSEDITAELDARFILVAGEFRRLFTVLEAAFRLTKVN